MNFHNSNENTKAGFKGTIAGVFKGFGVFAVAFLLEILFSIPIVFLPNICPKVYESYIPYLNFGLGVLVKYLIICLLIKWFRSDSFKGTKRTPVSLTILLSIVIVIIGYRLLYDNSLGLIVSKIPMNKSVEKAFEQLFAVPAIAIITIVFVAPIYEEILFRGIVLKVMSNRINSSIAILMSALFFAIMHMNLIQGINTFLLGIILGYISIKTESIYLCIFGHLVNNSLGVVVVSMTQNLGGLYVDFIRFGLAALGLVSIVLVYKWYNKMERREIIDNNKMYMN